MNGLTRAYVTAVTSTDHRKPGLFFGLSHFRQRHRELVDLIGLVLVSAVITLILVALWSSAQDRVDANNPNSHPAVCEVHTCLIPPATITR